MPMATSPLPWFAHPRGIYQMSAPEELAKQVDKMPVSNTISNTPQMISPSALSYQPFRFLRMDSDRREHHSPAPMPQSPEEHRERRTESRTIPTVAEEDAIPLDFSRPVPYPDASTKESSRPSGYGEGVVDLCTRVSNKENLKVEEERHNTSRGSSSDGSCTYNASSEELAPCGEEMLQQKLPHNHSEHTGKQQYPLHPVALHPHHHQHFIMAASAVTPQQHSPPMTAPEGTAVSTSPGGPQPPSFQGILSLTPPPSLPLHAPITASVPHPLSPPHQAPFPPMMPAQLHQTLAAATCKPDSGTKVTRPFKAYPKDPLTLTVGVSTAESLLGQASNEAYVEFRKQMLRQVAAAKARRPSPGQQSDEQISSIGESEESPQQQQQQQSSSSGDEDGTPGASKKRTRTGSESNSPYSVVKDAAYWERRRKNNEAAKRSRDARRAKEDEIAIRAAFLEQENLKLKYEVAALRHETSNLRCLLYSAANNS